MDTAIHTYIHTHLDTDLQRKCIRYYQLLLASMIGSYLHLSTFIFFLMSAMMVCNFYQIKTRNQNLYR